MTVLLLYNSTQIRKKQSISLSSSSTFSSYNDTKTASSGIWPDVKRDRYPRRVNMSACEPRYGKIGVFVAINSHAQGAYGVALKSLECYLKSTPYDHFLVNVMRDSNIEKRCHQYKDVRFRKHCAATLYLPQVDWLLLLDADTGVVNPNHCIEEYIDTRANIILYERAFDWELAVGNYMVRNNQMGHDFLMTIAEGEKYPFFGSDQGPLPYAVLKLVVPNAVHETQVCFNLWSKINVNDDPIKKVTEFFGYVSCCKIVLGSAHFWPGKLRIYRRFHAWVRDSYFNDDNWNEDFDFMIHNWKENEISTKWQSPFKTIPDPGRCGMNLEGWDWRPEKKVSIEKLREQLNKFEKEQQAWFPQEHVQTVTGRLCRMCTLTGNC